jgi:GNAT superfamily N-acetyltransferase
MATRPTRPTRPEDLAAVQRIWREVGWVDDDDEAAAIEPFLAGTSAARVAVLDGEAEASATVHAGRLLHTATDLPTAVVSSITVSRVGRKQGLARTLLAEVLQDAAADGAVVSILGMFEQGFYDTVGYGTGDEMLFHRFDPSSLSDALPHRAPVRLATSDHVEVAACMATRRRTHGGVAIDDPAMRAAELAWMKPGFGLGYRDDAGTLTHFLWCRTKGENGPYTVTAWAWQDDQQLRELLGLLRSFGDQVRTVRVEEPAELQLEVLVTQPNQQLIARRGGEHESGTIADAWWQARILDVPACVAALRTAGPTVAFDLELTDPATRWTALRPQGWQGVAGHWRVTLGPNGSTAEPGLPRDGVPGLRCSVNAFTRLWLGVRPPTTLATTDDLVATPGLLADLDAALRLPRPHPGMDF